MNTTKLTTIDLFAGCGGLMDGFQQSGHFSTLACVEWDKHPCDNLKHRLSTKWKHQHADKEVICFDIQRTQELFSGFKDSKYGIHPGLDAVLNGRQVNVIIGGPPCQAYSVAGRIRDEKGMKDDYRNYLFESYVKVVKRYKPSFFVFENVSGILSATPDGTPIISRIRRAFEDIGYCILPNLQNALFDLTEYGIPQKRKRIIILGVSKECFPYNYDLVVRTFYESIMPQKREPLKTVRDAIADLPVWIPSVRNGSVEYNSPSEVLIPNHTPRSQSVRDLKVFKLLTEDIESKRYQYISSDALKQLYTDITGHVSNIHKYYVLRWDQPSNTIPAHLYKDGYRHIHPDSRQLRTLTVREAARLQTFDDDYEFVGSMMHQYKMIGNAVPPKFSRILADAVFSLWCKFVH